MISGVVAIAIIVSIIILVYVNIPNQVDSNSDDDIPPETNPKIFSLIYDDEQINFTLDDLMELEKYTGNGGYRTQKGFRGFGTWTGVKVTTLINTLQSVPHQCSLRAFSEDGYIVNYSYSTILGNVDIYNPNNASDSNPIGEGNLIMVLAYQYETKWLNESDDGNLRIVFLDEQGSITDSKIWLKMVTSIRIITE